MSEFIFHDPSGRRARRAALLLGLLLSVIAAVVAAFFATLAFAPRLPDVHLKDPRSFSALHVETAKKVKFHPTLTRVPRRRKDASGAPTKPLTVGFYAPWDERSRVSLREHINQLDVFAPQWITPNGSLGRLTVSDDPQTQALLVKATHKPSVLPVIHNSHNNMWDGP